MKSISLVSAVLALTLSLPALASTSAPPLKLLGDPAPAATAARTIMITPNTRYVNVEAGQVVKFDVNGHSFTWNFDVAETVMSFDLGRVAPAGMLDHVVIAYVSPDPIYLGSR